MGEISTGRCTTTATRPLRLVPISIFAPRSPSFPSLFSYFWNPLYPLQIDISTSCTTPPCRWLYHFQVKFSIFGVMNHCGIATRKFKVCQRYKCLHCHMIFCLCRSSLDAIVRLSNHCAMAGSTYRMLSGLIMLDLCHIQGSGPLGLCPRGLSCSPVSRPK